MWLYIFVGAVILLLTYLCICIAHTMRLRNLAALLIEILQATEWADILEMLKSEEYVEAVLHACSTVLEEAR